MGKNWITSTFHISKEAENIETSDLLGFLKKKPTAVLKLPTTMAGWTVTPSESTSKI